MHLCRSTADDAAQSPRPAPCGGAAWAGGFSSCGGGPARPLDDAALANGGGRRERNVVLYFLLRPLHPPTPPLPALRFGMGLFTAPAAPFLVLLRAAFHRTKLVATALETRRRARG